MNKRQKGPPSIHVRGENVVGSIEASDHATVDVTQSSVQKTDDAIFERLFALLEESIEERHEDPIVDKQEIYQQVNQIKAEAALGEKANANKLERWIRTLSQMAPDVVDVMVASLGGPLSGITAVLHKIAVRVKTESEDGG